VLRGQGHHDGGELAALRAVDGDGEGALQVAQLRGFVLDHALGVLHGERAVVLDAHDAAHVAVVDLLLVVVAHVDDAVADAPGARAEAHLAPALAQRLAQALVERVHAAVAAVHRRHDLHVVDPVEAEALGDAARHDFDQPFRALGRILDHEVVEVAGQVAARGQLELLAVQDVVRVDLDQAGGALAVDVRQPPRGDDAGGEQVGQHVARTDAGQLVRVADQHEPRGGSHGLEQVVRQRDVEHRDLVDDDQIGFERVLGIVQPALGLGVVAEQAVHGLRLTPGRFREALGGATGG